MIGSLGEADDGSARRPRSLLDFVRGDAFASSGVDDQAHAAGDQANGWRGGGQWQTPGYGSQQTWLDASPTAPVSTAEGAWPSPTGQTDAPAPRDFLPGDRLRTDRYSDDQLADIGSAYAAAGYPAEVSAVSASQSRSASGTGSGGSASAGQTAQTRHDLCPPGTRVNTLKPPDYVAEASSYGEHEDGSLDRRFAGNKTSSGDIFDVNGFTAAAKRRRRPDGMLTEEPVIPLGTSLYVTDPATGKSVVVKVNDKGPLKPGRIVDLSPAAMQAISGKRYSLRPVKVYECE